MFPNIKSAKILAALAITLFLCLTHFLKNLRQNQNEKFIKSQIDEWNKYYAEKNEYDSLALKLKDDDTYGKYLMVIGSVKDPEFISDIKTWLEVNRPPFTELKRYKTRNPSPSFFSLMPLFVDYRVEIKLKKGIS